MQRLRLAFLRRNLIFTLACISFGSHSLAAEQGGAAEPSALPQLLDIDWQRGPNLPQGFQDSKGGVINGTLVSVAGFCSGQQGVTGKPDTYPRGFLKKAWGLPLKGDAASAAWQPLSNFPGVARQGLDAAVVADALFCSGGFNYDAPYSYRDGYRLSKDKQTGKWAWAPLPDLPWPLAAHGSSVIDGKIYVVGGADYDAKKFHTAADRAGNVPRLGARLLVLDNKHLDRGWRELSPCPGTPRFVHAVAAVRGRLYVIGGAASGTDAAGRTYTVVDNWRYDPASDGWELLPDTPVASGNFPAGAITYADRYILLIGGYQYGEVMRADGSISPAYGTPTRHYADNAMCSDVFVFDVETNTFGRATSLPLNNNLPMTFVEGDRIHLIGGEIGKATIDGEAFGHHPDLYLIGTIRQSGR